MPASVGAAGTSCEARTLTVVQFLQGAALIFGAAVVVSLISHRLRIPALLGLLGTGMLIGPSGLGFIHHGDQVEIWAEVGVMLLLFAIGLELSLERLRELRRAFLLGGGSQVAGVMLGAGAVAVLAGFSMQRSVFLGGVIALSSTAIVLSLYGARRELDTPHGKVMLAILLLQDFMIVPLIVFTPVLAGRTTGGLVDFAVRFGGSLLAIGLVFLLARWAVPALLHAVARTRAREVFVLGSLATCLAFALLTESLHFSLALGAFLAGIVLSESEYSHQIVAEMSPFRDVFSSLFFVSIGMLVDLRAALSHWPLIVSLAGAVLVGKALIAGLAAALLGLPTRIAVLVGLGLAQIGEFSLVLLEVGRGVALVDTSLYQVLLASALLTMMATPALVELAPRLANALADRLGGARPPAAEARELKGHVVVVGYGTNGRLLAHVLEEAGIRYVVIELNPETVRRERRNGRPMLFGDSTRPEILDAAGIAHAAIVVFAISDHDAVLRSVTLTRRLAPEVHILVRTRTVSEIPVLRSAGADHVIAEEFETAIEIFTRVLGRYHVPRNVIRAQTTLLRGEDYRMLRAPLASTEAGRIATDVLAQGTTEIFRLEPDSPAVGQTLISLDLRRRSGASVIAMVRGETSWTSPPADLELEAGDTLVLVGAHAEIEAAMQVLEESSGDSAPGG